jgi:Xaa-Pro aminopeptidase
MLSPSTLPRFQAALAEAGLDGWLLYDFRGINPIAAGLIGLGGMVTRRVFAWVPREGAPVAVTHAIEQAPWAAWPAAWGRVVYSGWAELEGAVGRLVAGRRVAMEYSPGDAVPYVDRVPAGVVDMVRALGATVETSAELVTQLYAVWTPAQLAAHQAAAEQVAGVARAAITDAARRVAGGEAVYEHEVAQDIRAAFARAGLEDDGHGPIVAWGPNAADPHYEPSADRPVRLAGGALLLVDLWARPAGTPTPFADQTWMGALGAVDDRAQAVWLAVRDARDAALALLTERVAAGRPVRGAEADDAARRLITERGFGPYFTHRTGHSIDARDLHGAGPHLDNLETREERLLVPGVGFSVEPGVYVPAADGRAAVGARSEVNAYVGDGALVVTPAEPQRVLLGA